MDAGKAWVILEEHFHSDERRLLSIVSPRKTTSYVVDLMEQMYVDKFASITERITYKKDRKKSAFRMEEYERRGPTTLSCGHEPTFRAYFCHKLKLDGDKLIFVYRVLREENGSITSREFAGSIDAI
ncbi:MAG: hypothetical protein HS112_06275 [Zoogloeaceae bacterium]|nr:hypothetical protein [Zoogloeaceae bacterium]